MKPVKTLFGILLAATTAAQAHATCPASNDLETYVNASLYLTAPTNGINSDLKNGSLRMYTKRLTPFDASKDTILIINGGPGGDHSIVEEFKDLSSNMNVIGFDHRGLGCTQITSRLDSGYYPGLFSMERAADDLDALRRDLLGEDGKWWVYGVSYGGMLGQKYVIKYPQHILGVILDSTFHRSTAIDVGRHQYKRLFIDHDPEVKALYEDIVTKYPDAKESLLWTMWGYTYSYKGRLSELKAFFAQILDAPTSDEARRIYETPVESGPISGMMYDILCSEIWDYPTSSEHSYYFAEFIPNCARYKKTSTPMNWADDLSRLSVRTLIWAGAFDPVTPSSVMQEMHSLIPNSLLYENSQAGHGLWWEKPECARSLLRQFVSRASDATINATAASTLCQSPPDQQTESLKRWEHITGQKTPSF